MCVVWATSIHALKQILPPQHCQQPLSALRLNITPVATSLNDMITLSHRVVACCSSNTPIVIHNSATNGIVDMYALPLLLTPGFNFGNIAHTISLASKQAALRGDNDLAITLLKPVIESLYDNFLTLDTRQRKTDHMGRLARVPIESASDRRQRYLRVGDEEHCLDTPEQYNHGTAVAQAAIACHEAIEAIDWKSGAWPFPEVVAHRYIYKLFRYVRRNGEWMRRGMSLSPEPTGSNPRDNYPGQAGTRWYTWKYRDLDTCEEYKGTLKDRPQDISKGSKEMAFVTDFVRWAKKDVPFGQEVDPIDVSRIFTSPDIRALIVTFLNRLVRSYSGNAKHRFACDIHGTLDDDPEVYAPKSCEGRYEEDRPEYAASWLVLALAARNFPASTRLQCDAYRMVKAVLPLALKGNKQFYPHSFSKMSRTWTAELIVAKYYFYNYDYGLQQTCESQDDLMRVAAPASLPGPHSQHQQAPDSAQHSNNPSDDVQPRGGSVSYPKHAFQWRDKVSP